MGSLGVAESHFILEETGRWGVSFSRSINYFPTFSFPATMLPLPRPPSGTERLPLASCKLLFHPQNPAQTFPCLGGFP